MSIDSSIDERTEDLQRWYSGYLRVTDLSSETAQDLADLAKEIPIFYVSPTAVELEYRGRDSARVVLRALLRLARLVRHAVGEVRCEVSGDADQLWFEFFRIQDGRLFRQRGEVVRHTEHEVTDAL